MKSHAKWSSLSRKEPTSNNKTVLVPHVNLNESKSVDRKEVRTETRPNHHKVRLVRLNHIFSIFSS